jgi:hypothetical protein
MPAKDIVVSEDEGQSLAEEHGIPFFLTSAKNNINVSEVCRASL